MNNPADAARSLLEVPEQNSFMPRSFTQERSYMIIFTSTIMLLNKFKKTSLKK